MKNYRTPAEVKKSILKGLDEAIVITKNISPDKASGESLLKFRKAKIGKQRDPVVKFKSKSRVNQNNSFYK